MKVRNGFVSNSSSSSFVVYGRSATINEIDDPHVRVRMYEGWEGECYFEPNKEIKDFIKEQGGGRFHLVYEYFSFSEEETMSQKKLMEKIAFIPSNERIKIECFQKDYYEPEDIENFKRMAYED